MSEDKPTVRELVALKRGDWPSGWTPAEINQTPYQAYRDADAKASFPVGLAAHIID